jgi:hypothetical protein
MKKFYFLLIQGSFLVFLLMLCASKTYATTYYNKPNSDLADTLNWSTNLTGFGGIHPYSFGDPWDTFIVQNSATIPINIVLSFTGTLLTNGQNIIVDSIGAIEIDWGGILIPGPTDTIIGIGDAKICGNGIFGVTMSSGIDDLGKQYRIKKSTKNMDFMYRGTVGQVIVADTFFSLRINNPLGVTLSGNLLIEYAVYFISGVMKTTQTSLIILDSTAGLGYTTPTSYVDGPFRKMSIDTGISAGFYFPVGKNGIRRGMWIFCPQFTTNSFTIEYFNAMPNDTSAKPATISRISSKEYWNIEKSGPGTADVILDWDSLSGIKDDGSTVSIVRWNGFSWVDLSKTSYWADTVLMYGGIVKDGVDSFNTQFTFGTTSTNNVLPIKLLSFTGKLEGDDVQLNWSTATEQNNDHFDVERSSDGENFVKIGEVKGAGNSMNVRNYMFLDTHAESSILYYRLKQVDYDGKFSHSNIVVIKKKVSDVKVYPNPFSEKLTIVGQKPETSVSIVDALGREIFSGEVSTPINTVSWPSGIYFVHFENRRTEKLLKN